MRIRIVYEDVARLAPAQKQALMKLAEAVEDSIGLGEMTLAEAGEVITALARTVERATSKEEIRVRPSRL